jgi:hypothetical protein
MSFVFLRNDTYLGYRLEVHSMDIENAGNVSIVDVFSFTLVI